MACNSALSNCFFSAANLRRLFFLPIVAWLSLISYSAFAGDGGIEKDPIIARLSGTAPVSGYSDIFNQNAVAAVFYTPEGEQTRQIKNIVTLSIIEESQQYITADFTATVQVLIEYGHTSSYGNSTVQTLVVDYKRGEGTKYNAKKYFSFEGAEYVKITIQSANPGMVGSVDIRNLLLLENEIRVTQYFNLANNVFPSGLHTDATTTTADELHVTWDAWTTSQGATHTQLEWAWVETEMESYYYTSGSLNTDLLFRNNSSRVDLPAKLTEYTIPKLYDGDPATGGKIYYRIRAVNIQGNGTRFDGPWSSPVTYSFNGHEPSLNWQSTVSFAEEGKFNAVIEYYDGSLRPRQTVTKDNVTKTTITSETFYDGQGRPAIQILPTPGILTIIKYQKDLNWFNGQTVSTEDPAKFFDLQPISPANTAIAPLKSNDPDHPGSAYYYSENNPEKNTGVNKYIPDAKGYPYAATQYTPDATGRVMSQSGVGDAHQMGSGKETKYYYGNAAQEELDGLFGTEVGEASHYFKNMVKDANGQVSISYVDMHGRTIATALAGPSPGNLDDLPINNGIMYPNQSPALTGRSLLDNNNIKENSLESVTTLLVPVGDKYNFTYSLMPDKLEMPSCTVDQPLCYDCLYDLEISITDESGDIEPKVWKFTNVSINPDDACSTATPPLTLVSSPPSSVVNVTSSIISFPWFLEIGSYSIRKTLTISEASLQHYKDLYAPNSVCKTRQEIIDSVYLVLEGQTNCNNPESGTVAAACTACMASLGASETVFRTNYLNSLGLDPGQTQSVQLEAEIHTAYQNGYENCQLLCNTTSTRTLETIRAMMLEDMKPFSGQYAREWDPNNPPSGETGWSAALYNKYDIFSTSLSGQPFYKHPKTEAGVDDFYRDALGNPDLSLYTGTPSNTVLNSTTKEQFQEEFKDSWANSLLYYHPEFKKLKYAEDNLRPSYNWIDVFSSVTTYADASNGTNNYVLTTGSSTAAPYNDPFYTLATPTSAYRDVMLQKIQSNFVNLSGTNVSMWQIAYGQVKCQSIGDPVAKKACIVGAPAQPPYTTLTTDEKDRVWQAFQSFYMNERRKDVNKYIGDHAPAPSVETNDLITQKYFVHFPETDQQIANQGNQTGGNTNAGSWTWWSPPGAPTGVDLNPVTVNANAYDAQCEGYIQRWKATLRPCIEQYFIDHSDPNAATLTETILTEMATGMKQVCKDGSDVANPYGSSNVAPTYSGSGFHSFEEVIHYVLNAHNIPKSSLCNPFIIEWPKPYGKGPRLFQEITNVVDQCACDRFNTLKNDATAANFNPNSFTSFNQYLQQTYHDVLTQVLYDALQNCNLYTQTICDSVTHQDSVSCYDPSPCWNYPLRIAAPRGQLSDSLVISQGRSTANLLGEQPPNCEQFNYMITYYFDWFGAHPPPDCQATFATWFNSWFQLSPAWNWAQISDLYTGLCGGELNVCISCTTVATCFDSTTNCHSVFVPFVLPEPQPLPEFLKCGFSGNTRCFSCAQLSTLTAEFKNYFDSPVDAAPVFDDTDPTADEIAANGLFGKFLNYRTGLQFDWLTYAQAAHDANPICNLANYINNTSANQNVICGDATPVNDPGIFVQIDPCQFAHDQSIAIGNQIWEERSRRLLQQFEAYYRDKCLAVQSTETFRVGYKSNEYHYTLYYYDMAGSLVKTVPPAGARPNFDDYDDVEQKKAAGVLKSRPHQLITQYRYNSLGQVVAQNSPDANTSKFWYDELGRLVVSQNAQQAADGKYSYTLFDDLGRIKEVGQKPQSEQMSQSISQSMFGYTPLNQWILTDGGTREQITFTVYDLPYLFDPPNPPGLYPILTQQNLRNRVSYTGFIKLATDPAPQQYAATFYSYDIHGNVDILLQDYKGITELNGESDDPLLGNRFKLLAYDYDLISGKVNMVSYQPPRYNPATSKWMVRDDAFYHKYKYDAQNRLTSVLTSRDKIVWERDAAYQYYKYGPLSRAEYGQQRVQGIDYAYTIQGWLKGVNSTAITASGGSCPGGTVMGDILNVETRDQYGKPSVYTAQLQINFINEFTSYPDDEFETLLEPGATICDPSVGPGNITYVPGDMGSDGDPAGDINAKVARDAYGFALNYFNNDYKPIGSGVQPFATGLHNLPQIGDAMITGAQLFNGNIASMLVNIPKLGIPANGNSGTNPILYGYRYDQLNRIVGMNAYRNDPVNNDPAIFSPMAMTDYRERVSYDPNGNIINYTRNGTSAPPAPGNGVGGTPMDQLGYKYLYVRNDNSKVEFTPGVAISDPQFNHFTNQLASVQDAIDDDKYTIDIDNQSAFNYEYDKIGNLVKDNKEHITNITWTVFGKIGSVVKDIDGNAGTISDRTIIDYTYDASGNRITKKVSFEESGVAKIKTTIYVRDASGNVMSVYEREKINGLYQALKLKEAHLYGSRRIGMITGRSIPDVTVTLASGFNEGNLITFTRNEKLFELSNHLGNVLVTISDKKKAFDNDADGDIDYYESDVATATDYYPFGMMMSGRRYSAAGSYRYGFNGKENDNEIKGEGNQQDYGMRIYDPRLGKFLSVDPLTGKYPWYTPYQFAGNIPIKYVDVDGLEPGSVGENEEDDSFIGAIQSLSNNQQNTVKRVNEATSQDPANAPASPDQAAANQVLRKWNTFNSLYSPVVKSMSQITEGYIMVLSLGMPELVALQMTITGAVNNNPWQVAGGILTMGLSAKLKFFMEAYNGTGLMTNLGKYESAIGIRESVRIIANEANVAFDQISIYGPESVEKFIVLGRNMSERVLPMVQKLKEAGVAAEYWNGFSYAASEQANLANNALWVKEKLKAGYTVIDIGLDPKYTRNVFLPFEQAFDKGKHYNMELSNVWKYMFSK